MWHELEDPLLGLFAGHLGHELAVHGHAEHCHLSAAGQSTQFRVARQITQ